MTERYFVYFLHISLR